LGHTIIGVEGAQKPVEEFFNENHIEHTVDAVDSVKGLLYQVISLKIKASNLCQRPIYNKYFFPKVVSS